MKTFLIYAESIEQVRLLSYEEAGQLLYAMLEYINDGKEFKTDNRTLAMAYSVFMAKAKAGIEKYEEVSRKRADAARKKWEKYYANAEFADAKDANDASKGNTNTNTNTNTNANTNTNTNANTIIEKEKCKKKKVTAVAVARPLEVRKKEFYESLLPYLDKYGKAMLRDFFEYWSEPNQAHTKMRWELERTWDSSRRLGTWQRKENEINKRNGNNQNNTPEERAAAVALQIERLMRENRPVGEMDGKMESLPAFDGW